MTIHTLSLPEAYDWRLGRWQWAILSPQELQHWERHKILRAFFGGGSRIVHVADTLSHKVLGPMRVAKAMDMVNCTSEPCG